MISKGIRFNLKLTKGKNFTTYKYVVIATYRIM